MVRLQLPPPGDAPQAIDFAADPVLQFLSHIGPAAEFQAAIAAVVSCYPTAGEGQASGDAAGAARRQARSGLFPPILLSLVASRSLARDFQGNSAIVEGLLPRGRTDSALAADKSLFDFGAISSRIAAADARLTDARATAGAEAIASALDAISNEHTGETHFSVRITARETAIKATDGSALPVGPGMVAEVNFPGRQ